MIHESINENKLFEMKRIRFVLDKCIPGIMLNKYIILIER